MNNISTGKIGENLACEYLVNKGYRIFKRNYRKTWGEIDIIARARTNILVFVEVKTRWSHEYGLPSEAITYWKIKALLKTEKFYVNKVNWGDKGYRLDFVGVDFADDKNNPKIELIKNIT